MLIDSSILVIALWHGLVCLLHRSSSRFDTEHHLNESCQSIDALESILESPPVSVMRAPSLAGQESPGVAEGALFTTLLLVSEMLLVLLLMVISITEDVLIEKLGVAVVPSLGSSANFKADQTSMSPL